MAGHQLDKRTKTVEVIKKSKMGREPVIPAFGVTRREELFCREVIEGSTLTEAYKLAYQPHINSTIQSIHNKASALFRKERVARRVEELYEQQDSLSRLDTDYVITNLISNHRIALESGDLTSSNKSLELLGRHLNLFERKPQADEQVASLFSWIAQQSSNMNIEKAKDSALAPATIEVEVKELDGQPDN